MARRKTEKPKRAGTGPVVRLLLLLLLAKFAFSTLSFGSGAAGGIFFPMLVLGSYLGGAVGSALSAGGKRRPAGGHRRRRQPGEKRGDRPG